jgi:hypothetical protein
MVRAEVLVGVTEVGERLQVGAGDPPPLTPQVRLTDELYPFSAVKVTVEVPLLPGATAVGVVAVIVKSATVAEL